MARIAVMSDSDNTKGKATAYFDSIYIEAAPPARR
jgi:hypothetical protein